MNRSKRHPAFRLGPLKVGADYLPLIIAEIGINHGGSVAKAKRMVRDAKAAGAECVKFQVHVIDDEMVPAARHVIPRNAKESIWEIMSRCAFSEAQDRQIKHYVEELGLFYLATPFSRAAADRLHRMNVRAYKVGSGECNNYPLLHHIASFGRPIILSTGMNNIASIKKSVAILREHGVPFALMNCTSMYPTPYDKVHLGAIAELKRVFPDAVVGQSDHSIGNYTCFAAVALGAAILEKHFTSDKRWPGPDIQISLDPGELHELVEGSRAVHSALKGGKVILREEQPTIDFAYACVVTIAPVAKGEQFSKQNVWVKRPGTGEIRAGDLRRVIGRRATRDLPINSQVRWHDISDIRRP
ncbi:MAG: N-acetylneuraminate synthase family protein [Alphaproteobacteria bacterium]|nr:N-acetylneuraminate synthase family protein [Alphaproteobacteria bacterium]